MARPRVNYEESHLQDEAPTTTESIGSTSSASLRRRSSGQSLYFRTGSTGYWVAILLPVALYISDLDQNKQTITAVAIIGFNAVLLCIFQFMGLNIYMFLLRMRRMNICLCLVILAVGYTHGGNLYQVASYLALHFTFPYIFHNIVRQHPKSFTFGEGVLVTSAFAFKFWTASQSLPFPQPESSIYDISETEMVALFLHVVFFITILGLRVILLLQKPWKLYILEEMLCLWAKYCIMAFFLRIPTQNDEVSKFLVMWPFAFLFANETRLLLMGIWAAATVVTGGLFLHKALHGKQTTTVDRKLFHFAIVAVFLPGVILDHTLIYCCSAVLLYIFLLIETARLLRLEILRFKIGQLIHLKVNRFRDHQDEGHLLVTPIYLLAGIALPIWLTGLEEDAATLSPVQYAACLAGIVSIGIGDTFASIGGSRFGMTRWKSTSKTMEGTVCSILAQLAFLLIICLFDWIPYDSTSVTALLGAVIINGIVEGNTNQIDNLVLPFITFIVIHGVSYILTQASANESLVQMAD